jgi:hypothetical protein
VADRVSLRRVRGDPARAVQHPTRSVGQALLRGAPVASRSGDGRLRRSGLSGSAYAARVLRAGRRARRRRCAAHGVARPVSFVQELGPQESAVVSLGRRDRARVRRRARSPTLVDGHRGSVPPVGAGRMVRRLGQPRARGSARRARRRLRGGGGRWRAQS